MRKKLGDRIRKFREDKEMNREDLADAAGLSVDYVLALEEQGLSASLGPLCKVSRALGVRLGTFLDDADVVDPVIVRKTDRANDLTMHSSGAKRETVRFNSLGKGKADRRMEPFHVELLPEGEQDEPELSSHQGEEFLVVTKGRVRMVHGRERHVLEPGDSLYFNSIVPHYVGCEGDEPAEIYAVLYFPE
jgi:transcriptional regulator with XRE-family HTH domain